MEIISLWVKDLGMKKIVAECLPTSVVGGAYDATFSNALITGGFITALNHIVPAGLQLKMLFLRISTQAAAGVRFSIVQTNPTALGQTGAIEAFPVMGSVPSGIRDYPMLEAAGAEVIKGSLKDPVHVLEGSIDFRILGPVVGPAIGHYSITWWGVEEVPEE